MKLDGFSELDALLDRALELEGDAQRRFLETLDDKQRPRIAALLERALSTDVDAIAGNATRSALAADTPDEQGGIANAGRWRLKRELGSGGMGQVFYAVREEDDYAQQAAVKILWSHRADASFKARFYRERRILASLEHPGLARFLDGGLLADGRPWFAMEYVDGQSITEASSNLGEAERLELFLAVCDSVQYAHERLIVHRDLKPQNIFVDTAGQPRLLDFGIATILGDLDDAVRTRTGGSLVTLQYASPEQVNGSVITVSSDVYQLGLLLYQMLTGRPPFSVADKSLREAVRQIGEQMPKPPSECDSTISADLDEVVLCALRKDPAERYHSVAALADDVRRYRDGYPVRARPQSRWYVTKRFLARNAAAVALTALVAVALTTATVISVRMADEARAEAERAQKTQQILANVFQQADPYGNSGADVTLADALLAATPSIHSELGDDPRLSWEVNNTLGEIFSSLGLVAEERTAYENALDAAERLPGNNERELMTAVAGLGNTLVRENPAEAADFFAAELPAEVRSQEAARAWRSAKYAEVNALTRLRQFERADEAIAQMAAASERYAIEDARGRGRLSQLLAGRATRAGDLEAADRHWRDAVAHMRDADNPFALAVTLSNRGIFLGQNGRYDESDAAFQQSLAVFMQHAPDDPTHASVLRTYAGLLIRMGSADASIQRLHEALEILEGGEEHYTRYVVLLSLASYALTADHTEDSFEAAVEGMQLAVQEFGAESSLTRRMLPLFARLLSLAGDRETALSLFELGAAEGGDASLLSFAEAAIDSGRLALAESGLEQLEDHNSLTAQRIRLRLHCEQGDETALRRSLGDTPIDDEDTSNAARHYRIWRALTVATLDADGPDGQPLLEEALRTYAQSQHVFLDTLDRQRMLGVLERLVQHSTYPHPAAHLEALASTRTAAASARELFADRYEAPVAAILEDLPIPDTGLREGGTTSARPSTCGIPIH